ncbi:MAG: hypothetical protein RBG13Loki_1007 [Promethearchaeota archaeon CR_4]|nr:MAG: hypothetical protein RBG13Loki_1007 [Candidatus Lokiarchaeota archaeon CR_4]
MFEDIAPGIQLVGRFGRVKAGIWFLRHGTECAIVEMPDIVDEDDIQTPWDTLHEYILRKNMYLKFITATHEHVDHFYSVSDFHGTFPEVPILVHRDFFLDPNDVEVQTTYKPADLEEGTLSLEDPSVEVEDIPLYCFDGEVFETHLSGEPLYLVHAPKHSLSDTLVVFRGCMITADWWLGSGDPNYNQVPVGQIHNSINTILRLCKGKNYVIHAIFSTHANEFRRNVNLEELMEQTRP